MDSLNLNDWLETCLKTVSSLRKMQAREKAAEERRLSSLRRDPYLEHLNDAIKNDPERKKMQELVNGKKR